MAVAGEPLLREAESHTNEILKLRIQGRAPDPGGHDV